MTDDYGRKKGGYQPGIGDIDIASMAARSNAELRSMENSGTSVPEFSDSVSKSNSSTFSVISNDNSKINDVNKISREKLKKPEKISSKSTRKKIPGAKSKSNKEVSGIANSIKSPITEAQARTFHSTVKELKSPDGLFTISYQDVNSIKFTDGSGEPFQMNLEEQT